MYNGASLIRMFDLFRQKPWNQSEWINKTRLWQEFSLYSILFDYSRYVRLCIKYTCLITDQQISFGRSLGNRSADVWKTYFYDCEAN